MADKDSRRTKTLRSEDIEVKKVAMAQGPHPGFLFFDTDPTDTYLIVKGSDNGRDDWWGH